MYVIIYAGIIYNDNHNKEFEDPHLKFMSSL